MIAIDGINGLARAGRTIAACLDQPYFAINTKSDSIPSATLNNSIFAQAPYFAFDIFILNADEVSRLHRAIDSLNNHFNTSAFSEHYRIGVWHWETSNLPEEMGMKGMYYDEIWTPSQYIAGAIKATPSFPNSTAVHVYPYGNEGVLPLVTAQSRALGKQKIARACTKGSPLWSTPEANARIYAPTFVKTAFVVLVVMDFFSDYNRKNVLGVYEAFATAFPLNTTSAELVIKTIHHKDRMVRNDVKAVQHFFAQKGDSRVHFISEHLSDGDLNAVKHGADCYVSLHKSEGWGFNLLEAVLMGVPVVATAYGGSEQFMEPLYRSLPELRVPARSAKVSRPFFNAYSENMTWGEPDLNYAAAALTSIYSNVEKYRAEAVKVRALALDLFSHARLGTAMKKRLQVVFYCSCLLLRAPRSLDWSERIAEAFGPLCEGVSGTELEKQLDLLKLSVDYCIKDGIIGTRRDSTQVIRTRVQQQNHTSDTMRTLAPTKPTDAALDGQSTCRDTNNETIIPTTLEKRRYSATKKHKITTTKPNKQHDGIRGGQSGENRRSKPKYP